MICLKPQKISFNKLVKMLNCLFHHVLITFQLIFKNREIKKIKSYVSVGFEPAIPVF